MTDDRKLKAAHSRIPREFWEALQTIHHHYFDRELEDFFQRGRPSDHILSALQTLDCGLDVAVEEEWLDG